MIVWCYGDLISVCVRPVKFLMEVGGGKETPLYKRTKQTEKWLNVS